MKSLGTIPADTLYLTAYRGTSRNLFQIAALTSFMWRGAFFPRVFLTLQS
jgi:hypothetical protein